MTETTTDTINPTAHWFRQYILDRARELDWQFTQNDTDTDWYSKDDQFIAVVWNSRDMTGFRHEIADQSATEVGHAVEGKLERLLSALGTYWPIGEKFPVTAKEKLELARQAAETFEIVAGVKSYPVEFTVEGKGTVSARTLEDVFRDVRMALEEALDGIFEITMTEVGVDTDHITTEDKSE